MCLTLRAGTEKLVRPETVREVFVMPLNLTSITWQITDVDVAGYSTWPSLAFSPSGQASVAYYSSDNKALRFATLNPDGVTWAVNHVDTLNGDCKPSLCFRFRQAAISYAATDMRFALNRGVGAPSWSINTFAQGNGDSSVAIGPGRRVYISYQDKDRALSYAAAGQGFSVWTGSQVDGVGNGGFNSLAFAPSGQPAIAYSNTADDEIKYAAFDGTHWHSQKVDDADGWCTLAFSSAGEPTIAYMTRPPRTPTNVMCAALQGGAWNRQAIALNADSPSLAFSPSGELAVSYHAAAAGAVKLAVFSDRTWKHLLVEASGKDQNGVYHGDFTLTSLAFSPAGHPAVAYFDRYRGAIRCAIGTASGGGLRGVGLWSRLRDLLTVR